MLNPKFYRITLCAPFLMVLLMLLHACSSTTQQSKLQQEIEQMDKEIMTYHDEAMPKMNKVMNLRRQINQQIDTCEDEMLKYSLQKISYELTKADKDMMSWMHQYQTPPVHDSSLHYLARQREEIKLIRDNIFSGIEKAEAAIKK